MLLSMSGSYRRRGSLTAMSIRVKVYLSTDCARLHVRENNKAAVGDSLRRGILRPGDRTSEFTPPYSVVSNRVGLVLPDLPERRPAHGTSACLHQLCLCDLELLLVLLKLDQPVADLRRNDRHRRTRNLLGEVLVEVLEEVFIGVFRILYRI